MKLKELEDLFKPEKPLICLLKDLEVGDEFKFVNNSENESLLYAFRESIDSIFSVKRAEASYDVLNRKANRIFYGIYSWRQVERIV